MADQLVTLEGGLRAVLRARRREELADERRGLTGPRCLRDAVLDMAGRYGSSCIAQGRDTDFRAAGEWAYHARARRRRYKALIRISRAIGGRTS